MASTSPAAFMRASVSPCWLVALATAAVLGVVLAGVYGEVVDFGFLEWDDRRHILDNPHLRSLDAANLWWMASTADIDYWRPLSFLSHALDFALWGADGGGHHLMSVTLHGVNAMLVFGLAVTAYRLVVDPPPDTAWLAGLAGVLAAAVFAVHPQHVESTAWLAERKGLLCAGFYLLAVLCHLRGQGVVRRWRYAALGAFVLAVLSKPLAVSLPLVLLALDVYPLRRLRADLPLAVWGRVVMEKWPYALVAAAVAVYTYLAVDAAGYLTADAELGWVERGVNAARTVWLYPWRWLYPLGLSPLYPMAMADNEVHVLTLAPVLALALAGVAAVGLLARGHGALAGVLGVYLALVGPVLGLVHTGFQSSADRYAYLPGALFAVVAALALVRVLARLRGRRDWLALGACVVLAWTAGLGVLAERQVGVWRSDVTMWRTVMAYHPTWVPYPELSAGQRALVAGDFERARGLLAQAVALRQRPFDAHLYLGFALQALGQEAAAVEHIERGIELAADSPPHLRLALDAHLKGGRLEAARALIARLRAVAPESTEALRQLAFVELGAGNPREAEAILEALLRDLPHDPRTLVARGVVAQLQGQLEAARGYYERTLAVQPANRDALHNLAELDRSAAPVPAGG